MTRLLDYPTLALMEEAAPAVGMIDHQIAIDLIDLLRRIGAANTPQPGIDGRPFHCAALADLAWELDEGGELISPKKLGQVVRAVGLSARRKTNGYWVYWNDAQLEILTGFFGKQAESQAFIESIEDFVERKR